jgi:hypothetical protein
VFCIRVTSNLWFYAKYVPPNDAAAGREANKSWCSMPSFAISFESHSPFYVCQHLVRPRSIGLRQARLRPGRVLYTNLERAVDQTPELLNDLFLSLAATDGEVTPLIDPGAPVARIRIDHLAA